MKTYEVVVIGAGPGGYQAALELGQAGVKTLLIDKAKEQIGGTCINVGCIPTKNYLQSALFISNIPHFQECGVSIDFNGLNLKELKDKTVDLKTEIRSGILWSLEQSKVELLYGTASFIDEKTVEVEGEQISFEKCIIAAGSKVRELPQLPLDSKSIISSDDVFGLDVLPKSIAIVGTGPIGCEFATFFSALGVEVTMIGRSAKLLSAEDDDVSKALQRAFKKSNIHVLTSTIVKNAKLGENSVELLIESQNTQESIECELVLSATGRIPNIQGLNLQNAGIKVDEKGFIETNLSFVTSKEHIYAVGDCINTPAFAHTAYAEAKIAVENIVNADTKTNVHLTPSTTFTNPQVASCGLKEKEANSKGIEIEVKKAYFKVNSKAKILGDDAGFIKLVICAKNSTILGASIIGVEATEVIHELILAIEKKLTLMELREVIHAHPTVSEIINYI